MTAKFFALLTHIGAAKLANATALGTRLEITHMAVGDGGGTLPTPNPAQTKLVNEQRRAALNTLSIDPINTSQIIAEQVIPEAEGGWWIREIGLLDKDGDLVAIANCAETYKPLMQEGSGRTQTIRVILIVSSTASVTLKIDPSVVLATRKYVDDKVIEVKQYADNLLIEHEKSRNHPDASKTEKGFVKLSSATTSDSEALAATPKAVKTVADNATKALGDHGKEANPHDQYLQIANLLSEIKAQGPAALAETLANLDLGDAAKRDIGAGNANVPDIATADNRYLKQSGGQVTGDSAPIIIRAATLNAALYLLAQQSDGSGAWYLGMPVAENNKLALRSYANGCEISLSFGRADVTVPLYIEGGKAYYPGNKPPLSNVWISGEYTPVLNTATVISHGIAGLDPLLCRADVLLKCVTANNGYFPGDFAVNFNIHSSANTSAAPLPLLTATQIQLNTGAAGTGLQITNKSSGDVFSPALSNWRYVFRLFY